MSEPAGGFVHRFVPGGSSLTLLALHGTGGDEGSLVPLVSAIAADAAVLSPRGRVLENGMPRFFRRIAEGVFDEADLRAQAAELAAFAGEAAGRYGFDPRGLVGIGYSNGANIAAALLLLHPGTLAGAALFRPMVPLVPDPLPDLRGLPVWMGAGRSDPLVPVRETERLAELLREAGADVTLSWVPGGHGLQVGEVEAAREWVAGAFSPGYRPARGGVGERR